MTYSLRLPYAHLIYAKIIFAAIEAQSAPDPPRGNRRMARFVVRSAAPGRAVGPGVGRRDGVGVRDAVRGTRCGARCGAWTPIARRPAYPRRHGCARAHGSGGPVGSSGALTRSVRRLLGRPGTVAPTSLRPLVRRAAERESALRELSDARLRAAADALRTRAAAGAWDDDALVELCALGREAGYRTLGERAFDVQLLGVLSLLRGTVVEMATGEGKTLVGALAAAGFAMQGRRVHVLSVNDYLARRDAEWMRPIYELLGVRVAHVTQDATHAQRRTAYAQDVVHVAVGEVGFDTLRDRLRTDATELVLPEPDVAIVDEADAVLIDEARIPLVLAGGVASGPDEAEAARVVADLVEGRHYEAETDGMTVHLTDAGVSAVERALGVDNLFALGMDTRLSQVNVALYASVLLRRDVDYLVREGRISLVDANRGRVAQRQRWPDGLHAAVEAKEGLVAGPRGEVLDQMIVQDLIGGYPTVAGMTGTAVIVAEQLREFYRLETGDLPTNLPCVRIDEPDRLYDGEQSRDAALIDLIERTHATGRPILVGTRDVAKSEQIGAALRESGLRCAVLNARDDSREAAIIADAGGIGAITVSTQMAGRGTDIRLGGIDGADHERVAELGGLLVVGVGRYPTRRLDDQLRGRAGRQGDPGTSVFLTSLDDESITRHAFDPPPRPTRVEADGRIRDASVRRWVEQAQRVAEGALLEGHRTTWRYNRQLRLQREEVLELRHRVLHGDEAARVLADLRPERWAELLDAVGESVLAEAARQLFLYELDEAWSEHLARTADLREGIHLRALGRQNPIDAFHAETQRAFVPLISRARTAAADRLATAHITESGLDTERSDIQRPSSTWTYMIHDQPFASMEDPFLTTIAKRVRAGAGED
ncbi:accessory Sec system translocase SecA2 [Embleya sp. NPDC127516]|uniref:accessory Sec system translocase SecA2 n=1 Tax=Embleya sp. NPDC127516 TaxID=3363990 RepID=UPI0038216023